MSDIITAQDEQAVLYALDMEVLGKTFGEIKRDTNMETQKLARILDALMRKEHVRSYATRFFLQKPAS